ncbi:GDSL-type esterase/lipase family protein [Marinobacter sp.]|uniref:GDSL-type esterase/lipase family protein n=1 Tax=Marinobacter sp. TaxID=50741 RepID=UPI003A8FE4D7
MKRRLARYQAVLVPLLIGCGYWLCQEYTSLSGSDGTVAYYIENMEVLQRRQLEILPETAIPFYGDSLVQGLAVHLIGPGVENFGIGHDNAKNLLRRVGMDLKYRRFSEYVMAIGINDISRGVDVRDIYNNISKTVHLLSFADTVYLNTVLPVADSRPGSETTNRKVRQVNAMLAELAVNVPNVRLIDSYRRLSSGGALPQSFHIGDGLHLNAAANRQWAALLKNAMTH